VSTYVQLVLLFGGLSLMSIGGGNVVLPEMHLRAVRDHHWLSDSQFADIFAISQAAPGPSILIVTLVGYAAGREVGGVPGGVVGGLLATAAMVIPAASVVFVVTQFWQRAQRSRWRIAVEKGFAPMTVGLILATSLVMSRTADHDWRAYVLTAVCTLIFVFTELNPLLVVAAAGVIGYFGIV
jgi:chromate transporter